jgi:hypothetical protein
MREHRCRSHVMDQSRLAIRAAAHDGKMVLCPSKLASRESSCAGERSVRLQEPTDLQVF